MNGCLSVDSFIIEYIFAFVIPCHTHPWGLASFVAVWVRGHTPYCLYISCCFHQHSDGFSLIIVCNIVKDTNLAVSIPLFPVFGGGFKRVWCIANSNSHFVLNLRILGIVWRTKNCLVIERSQVRCPAVASYMHATVVSLGKKLYSHCPSHPAVILGNIVYVCQGTVEKH